jgi:hypothetical protein
MKLFLPTLTRNVVRIFGFALLTTLLIPSVSALDRGRVSQSDCVFNQQ